MIGATSARRYGVSVLVLCAALLSLPAGCARRQAPPNVLLISVDTLRADHLGCYGYGRATSPNMDALAAQGVVFEHAYSPTSWTLPSHASMLSGVSPYRHGAVDSSHRIREDVPLLAERLRRHGYHTVAIVNAPFVQGKYGFARGFDRFVEVTDVRDTDHYQPQVRDLLEAMPRQPLFAFVHYMSVHSPYTPPPRFNRFVSADGPPPAVDGRRLLDLTRRIAAGAVALTTRDRDHLLALYDGEILATDDAVGDTIERARRLAPANTLVLVTSDHGEEFLEHGGLTHGTTLFDEVLHVPLILAGPAVAQGHRVKGMVSLLDLVPTVLETVGLRADPALEGRSLVPLLGGRDREHASDVLVLQTSAHDASVRLRGLRSPSFKIIADDKAGRRDAYDLRADPAERRPGVESPEASRLARLLGGLLPLASGRVSEPAAAEREALEALGYQ